MRARLTSLTLLAVLGVIAASDAARAQVPGVGPGHCVSGCGGSSGRSGGGRGGGMGGAAGAIGTAIGIGMAIGSAAAQQQQQQQAKEKSGARKEEGARKASHARDSKPEKPKEAAKQPADTKQAKLTQPAKNSNWSGCTGKVGTTWNAGNCGQPTMPTSSGGAPLTQTSRGGSIPYLFPRLSTQLLTKLACAVGFQLLDTFYGGTRCAPVVAAAVNAPTPPAIDRPEGDRTVTYDQPSGAGLSLTYPRDQFPEAYDPYETKLKDCLVHVTNSVPGSASPVCRKAHQDFYNALQDAAKKHDKKQAMEDPGALHDTGEQLWNQFSRSTQAEGEPQYMGDNACWLASQLDRDVGKCLGHPYSHENEKSIQAGDKSKNDKSTQADDTSKKAPPPPPPPTERPST